MEMDIGTAVWRGRTTETVLIDTGASATIFTPDPGKRFAAHYVFMKTDGAAGSFLFESGTNDLSGNIPTAASAETYEFCCSGMPVFVGRANGEAFVLTATTVVLDGFAVVTQLDGIL